MLLAGGFFITESLITERRRRAAGAVGCAERKLRGEGWRATNKRTHGSPRRLATGRRAREVGDPRSALNENHNWCTTAAALERCGISERNSRTKWRAR